jgi:hypothetical protein
MMRANWTNRMPLAVGITLMAVALIVMNRSHSAPEQRAEQAGSGPRFTVVETQAFNLLVTDNATNKLYYYTTDKDASVGSPMKLRASIDLSQVGREEIKMSTHNLENIREKEGK